MPEYLCGEYSGAWDFTGGYTLHIFPDGRVMLEETTDIPVIGVSPLAGEGQWTKQSDRILIFVEVAEIS